MADDQPVVGRLIDSAFKRLAWGREPVVIEVADDDGPATRVPGVQWDVIPTAEADNPAALTGAVQEQLADRPVLLGSSWLQRAAEGVGVETRIQRPLLAEAILPMIQPVGTKPVLAAVLPSETLASRGRQLLREAIGVRWRPAAVVYTTGALPGAHPGFEAAVLFLVPKDREVPLIIFRAPSSARAIDAANAAIAEGIVVDFEKLLRAGKGEDRGEHGYVVRDPLPPGKSLAFDLHDPVILQRRADLAGYGSTVSLGDLFEVRPGFQFSPGIPQCRPDEDGAVRVIGGRDIRQRDGILPPDEHSLWARVPPEQKLQAGDMVMRRITHPTDLNRGLVFAEVTTADLPAAVAVTVMVLRPRAEISEIQRQFTTLYLQSPLARTLAVASGHGGGLWPSEVASLVVPVPNAALTTALEHVEEAKRRLEAWREDVDELLLSVRFDAGSAAARASLIEGGRRLRTRVEAASLVDNFDHFVRTSFPHPIAYRWRRIEAAATTDEQEQQVAYGEILEAAEVLVSYMALVALAMSRGAHVSLGQVKSMRNSLSGGKGLGFGEWNGLLNEVANSGDVRRLPESHPLHRIRALAADTEATEARIRLNDRRNDKSHGRLVDAADLPEAIEESQGDLASLAEQARFLADWRLIQIVASSLNSIRGTWTVTYRSMMGDHSIVPASTTQYVGSELEGKGSLYLIDDEEHWHLLRPYLVGQKCAVCGTWSTFHLDMVKGTLRMKSLEHGHTLDGKPLREGLQDVGLL